MKNFSSLPNKHRGAVGRLEGQKMSYFQRTEADISSQCFQRYSSPHSFVIRLQLKDKTSNIFSWFLGSLVSANRVYNQMIWLIHINWHICHGILLEPRLQCSLSNYLWWSKLFHICYKFSLNMFFPH